jgi:hypothetical protein
MLYCACQNKKIMYYFVVMYFYLPTFGRISLQKETPASIKSRKQDLWMLSSTIYFSTILLVLLRKT